MEPSNGQPPVPAAPPFAIEEVTVGAKRIEAVVRVRDFARMRTSAFPGLAEEVIALLPDLRRHRCECGSACGILVELADTEIAHLLEHVALEMAALSGAPRTLEGQTAWDFAADGRGVFRVALDHDDERVMLAALSEANTLLAAVAAGRSAEVDVGTAVARIRGARGRLRASR